MQGTILGRIDEELEDDVIVKLITANLLTVPCIDPLIWIFAACWILDIHY